MASVEARPIPGNQSHVKFQTEGQFIVGDVVKNNFCNSTVIKMGVFDSYVRWKGIGLNLIVRPDLISCEFVATACSCNDGWSHH